MKIITEPLELRETVRAWQREGKRVGIVPTMGALHAGHLSLVEKSLTTCETTIVTIFVNPTQFAPHEDFQKYPRPQAKDQAMLESLLSSDSSMANVAKNFALFLPEVSAIYPDGFATEVAVTRGVSLLYEGAARPTHFAGVTTIVLKLFLMSGAQVAFFGEKDFQQLAVIRQIVRDLDVPIEIIGCPIVRENDGLAMSSRNQYLSSDERARALSLSRGLMHAKELVASGVYDAQFIKKAIAEILAASNAEIDYLAIANPDTLQEQTAIQKRSVILIAARFGKTRLIDNIMVSALKQSTANTRPRGFTHLRGDS